MAVFAVLFILMIIIFAVSSSTAGNREGDSTNLVNLPVPRPDLADPKEVIEFIDSHSSDVISQVYRKFRDLGYEIPDNLRKALIAKINNQFNKQEFLNAIDSVSHSAVIDHLSEYDGIYMFELKGVHVKSHKENLKECYEGMQVKLIPEPNNPYDSDAIKVMNGKKRIGRVPSEDTGIVHSMIKWKNYYSCITSMDTSATGWVEIEIKIYYKIEDLLRIE